MNIKLILISVFYEAIRRYVGTGVFDRIKDLVLELMEQDLSWEDKAKLVRDAVWAEVPKLRQAVIDLAIGTVMAKFDIKDKLERLSVGDTAPKS